MKNFNLTTKTLLILLAIFVISCSVDSNSPATPESSKKINTPPRPTSYYVPDGYLYTEDHEWVKVMSDSSIQVGITSYGLSNVGNMGMIVTEAMGTGNDDILKKRRPKIVATGTGSVGNFDFYVPVTAYLLGFNPTVIAAPSLVNLSPYTNWVYKMNGYENSDLTDSLMTSAQYRTFIGQ